VSPLREVATKSAESQENVNHSFFVCIINPDVSDIENHAIVLSVLCHISLVFYSNVIREHEV